MRKEKTAGHVIFAIILICFIGFVFRLPQTNAEALSEEHPGEGQQTGDELIVTFKDHVTERQAEKTVKAVGGEITDTLSENTGKTALLQMPDEHAAKMAEEELRQASEVKYVQPNYLYTADESQGVNDTLAAKQWNLDYMDVPEAWRLINRIRPKSQREEGDKVIVATLDTGIFYRHPDLRENIDVANCVSVAGEEVPYPVYPKPDYSHGTATAGILAATSDNRKGIAGVAAGTDNDLISLMGINVFSREGYTAQASASTADIIKGLEYACEKGAKVINMCLGHSVGYTDIKGQPHDDAALEEAINDAVYHKDVVVTCSAGNNGDARPWYPSDFDAVISVMNTGQYTNAWSKECKTRGSGYGKKKDISAPGKAVYTTRMDGSCSAASGTSISAPAVAGVAALVRYVNTKLNASQFKKILYSTATDLYAPGYDIYTGYGNVNACRAVAAAAGVDDGMEKPTMKKPSGVAARSAGAHSIKISWEKVPRANGYLIYRAASKKGNYKRIKRTTKAETLSYKDRGRTFNKRYYYKVVAYGTSRDGKKMQSASSKIVSSRARAEVPEPVARNIDSRTIRLSWKKGDAANGYRIYRSTSKRGRYKLVKSFNKRKITTWTDSGLKPGKVYYYKLKSYRRYKKKKYDSEYSSVLSLRARPARPSFSLRKKGRRLTLKWKKAKTGIVSGYQIYRKRGDGKWRIVKQKNAKGTIFVNKNLYRGEKYSYRIRSYKVVKGEKIYSDYSRIKSKKI